VGEGNALPVHGRTQGAVCGEPHVAASAVVRVGVLTGRQCLLERDARVGQTFLC